MPEPHPSEDLIGQSRASVRPDLRLLCGIYDQLAAIRDLLTPAAEPPAPTVFITSPAHPGMDRPAPEPSEGLMEMHRAAMARGAVPPPPKPRRTRKD